MPIHRPAARRSDASARPRIAAGVRVHCCGPVVNDIFVAGILEMALRSAVAEQSSEIRLVIAEQQAIRVLETDEKRAERRMPSEDDAIPLILQRWFLRASRPAPDVSEPGLRRDMDGSRFGAAVMDRHPHKDVIHLRLGIFDLDIKVSVIVENTGL